MNRKKILAKIVGGSKNVKFAEMVKDYAFLNGRRLL
jgi:hypothetical protein